MHLTDHLTDIQDRLRAGAYPNEAAISGGIVRRVLDALGWPVYDPHVVYPEYTVKGRRVDFALCHPADKARVFVEVKQPGQARGADQQLFEYAFHEGVPMAVMTDGREWHVYVPAGAGSYDERRVYLLDLLERSPAEAAERLTRYLAYDRVRNEEAVRAARDDYDLIARSREGERYLPTAWERLLSEPDAALVALMAEKVESLCGVRPDEVRVTAFLRANAGHSTKSAPTRAPLHVKPVAPHRTTPPSPQGERGFALNGTFHEARTAADAYRRIMAALIQQEPGFAARFASEGGRSRAYLARDKAALFPGRPDLQATSVAEMPHGWWLGLNVSRQTIDQRLRRACELAGLTFGKDLVLRV